MSDAPELRRIAAALEELVCLRREPRDTEPRFRAARRKPAKAPALRAGEWLDYADSDATSAVYVLGYCGHVVYIGQSGDLHSRISYHRQFKCIDSVRVLPLPDNRRVRTLVERHVRELVGETFYRSGESVRDRIEMERPGPPVDAPTVAGTHGIVAAALFLRWALS